MPPFPDSGPACAFQADKSGRFLLPEGGRNRVHAENAKEGDTK